MGGADNSDQSLKAMADTVCAVIQQSRHQPPGRLNISFFRAGEQLQPQRGVPAGLLFEARERKVKVDFGVQLNFPEHINKEHSAYIWSVHQKVQRKRCQ